MQTFMAAMRDHLHLLEMAAIGSLPDTIDGEGDLSLVVVRELLEAGYLNAIDVSTLGGEAYLNPRITLAGREYLQKLHGERFDSINDLIAILERTRDIMVAVSTGGPRIDDLNPQYRQLYDRADKNLRKLGIAHSNHFADLWDWHGRWSSGDLPSYRSRREYLAGIFGPLLKQVREHTTGHVARAPEPTGQFNLELGLQVMKDALRGGDPDAFLEFSTLESRLIENIRNERQYGSTETVRSERARIVQELNRLAIEAKCGRLFNEMCSEP